MPKTISLADGPQGRHANAVQVSGLTVVAVVALSVAIGAGAAYLEFVSDLLHPTLPVQDGHRVAGVVNWNAASGRAHHGSLHDFTQWRQDPRSIVDLGAARQLQRRAGSPAAER